MVIGTSSFAFNHSVFNSTIGETKTLRLDIEMLLIGAPKVSGIPTASLLIVRFIAVIPVFNHMVTGLKENPNDVFVFV